MLLQLGLVDNIPKSLTLAVQNSHKADKSVPAVDSMYYAGGWSVNENQSIIEHSGNNPSFTTQVLLFPNEKIGICLLTNSNTANIELVYNIKDILDGNISQSYKMGIMRFIDVAFTLITIFGCIISFLFFTLGVLRRKKHVQKPRTRIRIVLISSLFVITSCC